MFTSVKNLVLVAMLACIGFIAAGSSASAQTCHCTIVNGCKVITFYDAAGNPISTETVCPGSGTGDFQCTEAPPTGPLNVSLPPQNILANSHSPILGPITTLLDPARISSNATIVSNFPGIRFPATGRIRFYARSIIGGVEYCSRTELVFVSFNLFSFQPFQNEKFCLENTVEFYRCDDPLQRKVFTLDAGSTCVTLN